MRACIVLLLLTLPAAVHGQQRESWEDRIEVRQDRAMFAMWAWLTLVDTTSDRSAWLPAKHHVRERLEERLSASYRDSLEAVHRRHASRMLGYHATMLALHVTPPPAMRYDSAVLALYATGQMDTAYLRVLQALGDDILPLLNELHERAALPELMNPDGAAPRRGALRHRDATRGDGPPSFSAHEYIHYLVRPLLQAEATQARMREIVAAVRPQYQESDAAKYYPDPLDYFEESLVRTIDFSAEHGPELGFDNARLKQLMGHQHSRGFVLVHPLRDALVPWERSSAGFAEYFPELLERLASAVAPPAREEGEEREGEFSN